MSAVGYDDACAIFTNPAALGQSKGLKAISMSGKMLQDVNYFMLGLADTSPIGRLGIGFVNAAVPTIPLTTVEGTGATRTVVQTGTTDYSNSLILISYATEISKIFKGKGEKIYFGANLKYFLQGFSGGGSAMQDAVGAGMDADLGLLAQPSPWLKLGLKLNNFLPSNFGGKFTWQKNGLVEGIPMTYRLGANFSVLGPAAMRKTSQTLDISVDYENFSNNNYPAAWHTGLEFRPVPLLVLRAGVDQKPKATDSGISVDNDLTGGVGLNFFGLTFDYAYHQYGDISENTTHFFSIGYKGSDTTSLASLGQQMRKSQVPQVNVVPKPIFKTFTDVPAGYWAKQPIDYISALKIMSGYPDGSFRPDQPISKGDLVNTLNKAKWYNNKGPAKEYFPKGYNPSTKVTRAEAAKVFADYAGLYQKDKVSQQVFPDVEIEDSSSPAIAASKEAGFFEFLAGKNFGPDEYVTRAEAAEMLSKVPFIKEKIKNLISGE